jgi:competence protein ComEC
MPSENSTPPPDKPPTPEASKPAPAAGTPRNSLTAFAPLGLVLAPALLKFAGTSAPEPDTAADVAAEVTPAQCIQRSEGAPIHTAYQGTGDVQEHLNDGTPIQILSHRKNWTHISYASQGESVLGWVISAYLGSCAGSAPPAPPAPTPAPTPPAATGGGVPHQPVSVLSGCGGKPLSVKFYDAGQALSALVSLPDGRRVLVDTGQQPTFPGCGTACKEWSDRLLNGLQTDVPDKKLAMVWITHQHSDHAGNAPTILREFSVGTYVDNGTNLDNGIIKKSRAAATERSVAIHVVDPDHRDSPIASGGGVKLTPVLPTQWVDNCDDAPNDCSIGLRLDYCSSSILFTGDAEDTEEAALDPGPVTLLQVGHHGSDTSSSADFIKKVSPKYAVISAAKEEEGTNRTYCHPRQTTVVALSTELGGKQTGEVEAFDADVKCKAADAHDHWRMTPTSNHLWLTERDGDIDLVTTGDGTFQRQTP